MTGSDRLDLAVIIGGILFFGWLALKLVDWGTSWVDRREARADLEWRTGVSAETGVMVDSQRPDIGAGATVLPAVAMSLGADDYGRHARIVRPYSRLVPLPSRMTEARMQEMLDTVAQDGLRELVRLGGTTTAVALAHHIEKVQRAHGWRRMVDDWEADWEQFLADVESGRYAADAA